MVDPLSEGITLLQPRAVFSRPISGAGRWGVRYTAFGEPSFCAVLQGACRLAVDGHRPVTIEAGDFVLLPATPGFSIAGFETTRFERLDPWYVLATEDRIIPPAAQRQMATRANAEITEVRGSHAIYISQPDAVADAIDRAARAASQ